MTPATQALWKKQVPRVLKSHIGQRAGRYRPSDHSTTLGLVEFPGPFPKRLKEGEDRPHTARPRKRRRGDTCQPLPRGRRRHTTARQRHYRERLQTGDPREHRRQRSRRMVSDRIQRHPEGTARHERWGLTDECPCGATFKPRQCNSPCQPTKEENTYDHVKGCLKKKVLGKSQRLLMKGKNKTLLTHQKEKGTPQSHTACLRGPCS